ncbi:MAG: T9SS type A sorting domain-containing protein, partial [Taibaiella sp.]|nr:T9SS type A sorting domain-containing protein [Taibaiella sp.]
NGSKQKTVYTYNNNLLVERIYFTGNGRAYKTLYSYDSNGLLTGELMSGYDSTLSVWDTAGGRNFIYNSSNQLLQEKRWRDNGYVWLMIDITYDGSNNRVEDVIHCDYSRPGLSTGFVKYVRKQYRYNSFGLINDYEVTHWNDSLQAWELAPDSIFNASQKVKLEYEVYWPQEVSRINTAKSDVTIFPSPASGFITVKAEDMPGGSLEAIIYDMQGRILRRWTDEADGSYLKTIPVQELPSGTYFLQLTGKDISRNTQFVIYR